MSPVVQGLDVGLFGVNFGWHFAAYVLTAHLAFGAAMASLLSRPDMVVLRAAGLGVLLS